MYTKEQHKNEDFAQLPEVCVKSRSSRTLSFKTNECKWKLKKKTFPRSFFRISLNTIQVSYHEPQLPRSPLPLIKVDDYGPKDMGPGFVTMSSLRNAWPTSLLWYLSPTFTLVGGEHILDETEKQRWCRLKCGDLLPYVLNISRNMWTLLRTMRYCYLCTLCFF